MSEYKGEIKVGMKFVWMGGTKAQEHVTVTRITTPENDERRIWTKGFDAVGGEYWNDESRFREAVAPFTDDADRIEAIEAKLELAKKGLRKIIRTSDMHSAWDIAIATVEKLE